MDQQSVLKIANRFLSKFIIGAVVVGIPVVMSGCSSDNNSDSGTDLDGVFTGGSNAGRIAVDVVNPRLPVADTSGFRVNVQNQDGAAVPAISVICDSEQGVAIIEPNTGQALTDSTGSISGRIGCEAPGSFQFGCRLPTGSNLRKFVQVVCEGTIPAGFTGFPNSGGGGLGTGGGGGGVDVPDDGAPGGTGIDGLRLTQLSFNDAGSTTPFAAPTLSIDVAQRNCQQQPPPAPVQCEVFRDSVVSFRVINNSNQSIQVTGYNYTVLDADGAGASFTSSTIAPTPVEGGSAISAFGGELTFTALFANVTGSLAACGGVKRFIGSSEDIPDLGVRNVTVRVFGRNESGDTFTLTGRQGISFTALDRCTS